MSTKPQDKKIESCLLCDKINSGEAEEVNKMGIFSFTPDCPMAEGHRIFAPRDHIVNPRLSSGITGLVMSGIIAWAESRSEGYDIILSQGPSYSTDVDHMHVHYIPKTFGKSGIANKDAWIDNENLQVLSNSQES